MVQDNTALRERVTTLEVKQQGIRDSIELSSKDLERRLSDMNRFREQILEERGLFVTTKEYDVQYEGLRLRIEQLELAKSNMDGRLWVLGTVFTVVNAVISGALILFLHHWK